MKQVKCTDCGEVYMVDLKSCPNCGCPNDEWQPMQEKQEEHTKDAISHVARDVDWAHYVYECGVLIWHTVSRKYICFSGRASRREFWSLWLFADWMWISEQLRTGAYIWTAILLLPLISAWVRRMHDINKSGWWSLVPIVSLFCALKKSDEGENDYGKPSIDDI